MLFCGPGAPPPATSTLASGISTAAEWYRRARLPLAPTVQVPVCGFQISALLLTLMSSFQTELPPVASTLPSARTVALTSRRWVDIDPVDVTTGAPLVMSITTAPLELPPNCRMRPGRNMAALASLPVGPLNWPALLTAPLPAVLT